MADFCMPSLGSDMEDGTLIEWEKHVGDAVHRGDVIAVVETQKGAIEIEVYEDGVIENVLVSVGDKVPVGTPLALIGDGANVGVVESNSITPEKSPQTEIVDTDGKRQELKLDLKQDQKAQADATARSSVEPAINLEIEAIVEAEPVDAKVQFSQETNRLRVTPAARRLASEAHIDLMTLIGTGTGSAVVLDDVKSAIERNNQTQSSQSSQSETDPNAVKSSNEIKTKSAPSASPMEGMRAAIAAAMSRSKREIPHYYLSHTIAIDNALEYIRATNADRVADDRLVLSALFIKSVALATKQYPEFNGYFENDVYTPSNATHIGMAINIRGGGLVAPAIHTADELSLDETMAALKDLVARVRKGRFKASELSSPTLTVSSLGERGVDSLYGVIYPPQVAIVGFGTPVETVNVRDGAIVPINTVTITLAADHRVSDGHRGSLFLRAIALHLQKPEELE